MNPKIILVDYNGVRYCGKMCNDVEGILAENNIHRDSEYTVIIRDYDIDGDVEKYPDLEKYPGLDEKDLPAVGGDVDLDYTVSIKLKNLVYFEGHIFDQFYLKQQYQMVHP